MPLRIPAGLTKFLLLLFIALSGEIRGELTSKYIYVGPVPAFRYGWVPTTIILADGTRLEGTLNYGRVSLWGHLTTGGMASMISSLAGLDAMTSALSGASWFLYSHVPDAGLYLQGPVFRTEDGDEPFNVSKLRRSQDIGDILMGSRLFWKGSPTAVEHVTIRESSDPTSEDEVRFWVTREEDGESLGGKTLDEMGIKRNFDWIRYCHNAFTAVRGLFPKH